MVFCAQFPTHFSMYVFFLQYYRHLFFFLYLLFLSSSKNGDVRDLKSSHGLMLVIIRPSPRPRIAHLSPVSALPIVLDNHYGERTLNCFESS